MENGAIRVRACLAVIQNNRILLVPHFDTDAGPIQWNLPGGKVEFGESVQQAAIRELKEETGISARIVSLLDVSEVIVHHKPWHSVTISYLGELVNGELKSEGGHKYGQKLPKWFTVEELERVQYHPASVIKKALGIR